VAAYFQAMRLEPGGTVKHNRTRFLAVDCERPLVVLGLYPVQLYLELYGGSLRVFVRGGEHNFVGKKVEPGVLVELDVVGV